jgi:predicted transcriptional regulator
VKVCLNQQLYCNLSVGKVNPETAIIDTFLIINLFNVYLAHAKQAFNVSGRYYLKTLFEFQDMYDIIRKEFENMYEYMKVLVNRVTGSYQLYSH